MTPEVSDLIVLTSLVASTVTFAIIARAYVWPWMNCRPMADVLQPILLLHTLRHVGLMFLAPGALVTPLPVAFAVPAAFGDLLAAALAFIALAALRLGWRAAPGMVWTFNVIGTADLCYAVGQGVATGAASGMGAAFWIPAVIVPALLVTHGMAFVLLIRFGRAGFARTAGTGVGHSPTRIAV